MTKKSKTYRVKEGERKRETRDSHIRRAAMKKRERQRACRIEEVKESRYGDRPGNVMHHVIEL